MSQSVKFRSQTIEVLRAEAARKKRSIAGQAEYWIELGQYLESMPGMTFERVDAALDGKLARSDLNELEQVAYIHRMAAKPTRAALDNHGARRAAGGGVGIDENGRLVRRLADGRTVPYQ